ncbi:MAG: DUF1566 domain-containing protein [Pseudomonadota bacterium]
MCDDIEDLCTVAVDTCLIGASASSVNGTCYTAGQANPTNTLEVCSPGTSQTSWSPDATATVACDDTNAVTLCGSLDHCVDGFCCNTTCEGACEACNLVGHEGQCSVLGSSVECRSPAGPCDLAETCTGQSPACPEDLFQDGTLCGTAQSGDLCDLDDYCNGLGVACPDNFRGAIGERCSIAGECCEGTCNVQRGLCSIASCVGADDWTPCVVVTTPDRGYDICMGGECISPGCGDGTCNLPGPHFPLADTNLLECYDGGATMTCPAEGLAFFGQDAQYGWDTTHDMTERFTKDMASTPDPVLTDNVTGLQWQACPGGRDGEGCAAGNSMTSDWQTSLDYCDGLDWGGHADWRLPDEHELLSITHAGRTNPAIDERFFPFTPWGNFWTLSTYADGPTNAWRVSFGTGNMYFDAKTTLNYTRCVRGGPFVARQFDIATVNGDRVVTDTLTGLQWQGCVDGRSGGDCSSGGGIPTDWASALSICEDSTWAAFEDWRLPNIKELESIADHRRFGPAIDTVAFPFTPSDWSWSSTAYPGNVANACPIGFGHGFMGNLVKTNNLYVRCVRLGM